MVRCSGVRGERGDALIELAVMFSLVGVPLLLGTVQMGFLVYDSVEISNAANAGALYGMQNSGYASSSSGITSAAQAEAADFGTKLTVTPTTYYACTNAVGGTQYPTSSYTQTQAATHCGGTGNQTLEFVQVTASASVTPLIHCPGLPTSYTLTDTSVMEVEQ
jgi:Flp pilus assembly protein TadG